MCVDMIRHVETGRVDRRQLKGKRKKSSAFAGASRGAVVLRPYTSELGGSASAMARVLRPYKTCIVGSVLAEGFDGVGVAGAAGGDVAGEQSGRE